MMNLLKVNGISKSYFSLKNEIEVLKDVSFEIYENEIVGLLGPSGCGKSTILNILSSLEGVTKGDIKVNCKIGYMFQKDALLPWKNVFSNVCFGLEIKKNINNESLNYAKDLIKKYKLEEFKHSYPSELSGGMKQRTALIRTLVLKPDLLLLDEPFSALDAQTKLTVQNDVYSIIKQEKKSALIVTHDISEAIALCDRIIILSERPAGIKKILTISINNLSPLNRRNSPEFNSFYKEICENLGIN